jgi:zinc transport system permease protein
MIELITNYQFIRYALVVLVFASVVCGIIGVIIVQKKLTMMAGGIAHSAYGGVGLGYLLGVEPLITAAIFSAFAAIVISFVKEQSHINTDVVISMFWSFGMAMGIIFIGMLPGYPPDMNTYLFGNVLSVTNVDLILITVLTFIIVVFFIIFFDDYQAYLLDEEYSMIMGINNKFLNISLMLLISLAVVVLIKVVGIMMVIAMLAIPAAIANIYSKKLKNRMVIAIVSGIMINLIGISISIGSDLPTGAVIIVTGIVIYIINYVIEKYMPATE